MQNYKKRCSIIVITWGIQVFVKTDMIGGLTGPLYSLNHDFKKHSSYFAICFSI